MPLRGQASSTFTSCATLYNIPRTVDESGNSTVWCIRFSPRARTVALWRVEYPSGLRMSVIRRTPPFVRLSLAVFCLAMFLATPERLHLCQVFVAAARFGFHVLHSLQALP